ncbi:hypothetical protein Ahy_A01g003842 isoform D [Arachis hypogaea]|uniref:phosphogluconate dehydrogenase (NADP(+)-dependent, decarboxylating) n=1 Tax=Arachis hypogaea TaxID=3818 RepID=A0A445EU25_ARAHY|nr:hypothetical protein Ahy_A01g003842 isoform D [Arachis hypogaea]
MIHNGIAYGDMQLIAEAYDVLKLVGKLSNEDLHNAFAEWNKGELRSFLIEITADIFGIKDGKGDGYLVHKVLDKTGMKGTCKWTVQQAAELSVAAPTIESSLDARFLSGLKEERVEAAKVFKSAGFEFAKEIIDRQSAWRRIVCLAINSGISTSGMSLSLAYFDTLQKGKITG